jgi:hypothetical protein
VSGSASVQDLWGAGRRGRTAAPGPRCAPDVPLVDAVRDGANKGRHVRDRQPLAPRERHQVLGVKEALRGALAGVAAPRCGAAGAGRLWTARLQTSRRSSASAGDTGGSISATHLMAAAERVKRLLHALLAADAPGGCLGDLSHARVPGGAKGATLVKSAPGAHVRAGLQGSELGPLRPALPLCRSGRRWPAAVEAEGQPRQRIRARRGGPPNDGAERGCIGH